MRIFKIFCCPKCRSGIKKVSSSLVCKRGHKFLVKSQVPIMAELDSELTQEASAWEDEWKKGVPTNGLIAYQKNMSIFKKLGFWEETGEAAKFIPTKKDWVILDLGCGNGVSTVNLRGETVIGLDLSPKQLIRAKKKFPNRHFVVGDATKLPFKSNSFDLIVEINVLHHLGNKTSVGLKECYRVLKRGGKLLTVDPNLTNPFGFTVRELFKLLKLKRVSPPYPQFALQDDEYQFTKESYYQAFKKSPFKKFKIYPHRIERIMFFVSILIPPVANLPFFEYMVKFSGLVGNFIVGLPFLDRLCYFWKCEAIK